jgi:hypothetical protein
MGREKWFILLERGDRKVFRIQRRFGKWVGFTRIFRGEVFETLNGRRVKTSPNWDFKTEKEAIAWAMTDNTDAFPSDAKNRGV